MNGPFRLDRALIRISGPEARPFLHNLLTQNIETLKPGEVRYGGLLTPQGKVSADMLIWSAGDDIVLEADPARAPALLLRLRMYKLRAQVSVDPADYLALAFAPERFDGARADPRLADGELGWRALRGKTETASLPAGDNAFDALRLRVGVPDLARDAAPDEVFALEALFDELSGVDFQKGCFTGQENVSRMKRRATTRKKFCPIAFDGEAPPPATPIRAGEAELGTVRSGALGHAIAFLRLDRAAEAAKKGVQLTAGDRPIRLDPPPWLLIPETE